VPLVLKVVRPRSAIDVGCGAGGWVRVLGEHGVETIGVDGSWVPQKMRSPGFIEHDLEQPFRLDRRFDLAICLEVAQHLSPAAAERFVSDLVTLAPAVLFSSAIPLQGGFNQRNEQWPSHWARLFAVHNYHPHDVVRPHIWTDDRVEAWYVQNTLLYCRGSAVSDPLFLDLVHPRHYLAARRADRERATLTWQVRSLRRLVPDRIKTLRQTIRGASP
jgi:SAM-dependent methyltransferase